MKIKLGYVHMSSQKPNGRLCPDYYYDKKDRFYSERYAKEARECDPDEQVLQMGEHVLRIEYPLREPYVETFVVNGDGMTRRQLVNTIIAAYKDIYKDEAKYGIWGHEMADLMLHTAYISANKVVTVSCDS